MILGLLYFYMCALQIWIFFGFSGSENYNHKDWTKLEFKGHAAVTDSVILQTATENGSMVAEAAAGCWYPNLYSSTFNSHLNWATIHHTREVAVQSLQDYC